VSQAALNSGQGYINFMNYATGEMEVGGTLGVVGTGARVQINDPTGRFTRGAISPDDRFQVDPDNPTILSETGFPMCFPRVVADPTVVGNADDPLCPQTNRPISNGAFTFMVPAETPRPTGEFATLFRMDSPANVALGPAACVRGGLIPIAPCLDPRKQAPFEVGDYITFAGTRIKDVGRNGFYISAHTIVNNIAIYTAAGIDPAYVTIGVSLIGTGGLIILGVAEAAIRTRFEGMTTDETRLIRLFGNDINPVNGVVTDREWGTILPQIPPTGPVRGRWRFRPPCTGAVATDKVCTPPPAGVFVPPTREVRAVITGLQQFLTGTHTPNPASQVPPSGAITVTTAITTANGIFYGQYHAPINQYIFPENIPGNVIPENNFNTIDFLAQGGYRTVTGVQAKVLNPWPSNILPSPFVCPIPTIIGSPYSVGFGGSVTLSGGINANATSPTTLSWIAGTAPGGTNLNGALTNANTTQPIFNAGAGGGVPAGTYFLTFTASNVCGIVTASGTITVGAAPLPVVNPILNQTVNVGAGVSMLATSNSLPAPTFAWVQTGGPAVALATAPVAPTPPNTAASRATFTPLVAGVYTFNVTATNVGGTSPATPVVITVNAAGPLTNITVLSVSYRVAQQRLVVTASSADPTVTNFTLQPYLTENGTTFNPGSPAFSLVNGVWTLTFATAQRPACNVGGPYALPCAQKPIIVKSSGGAAGPGTSLPTGLTLIR